MTDNYHGERSRETKVRCDECGHRMVSTVPNEYFCEWCVMGDRLNELISENMFFRACMIQHEAGDKWLFMDGWPATLLVGRDRDEAVAYAVKKYDEAVVALLKEL